MRIALIPSLVTDHTGRPRPYLPIGLLSLKSLPEVRTDHDVHILDLNHRLATGDVDLSSAFYDSVAQDIARQNYDIVGFSSLSISFQHVISVARRLKILDPEIVVIVGGPGPQTDQLASEILRCFPCIDHIVIGEGEWVFPRLLSSLSRDGRGSDVPAVFSRQTGDEPQLDAPLVENLDTLPFLDLESLDTNTYSYSHEHTNAILRIEEGRGCPFRCSFCSTSDFWQRKARRKSAKRLVAEMDFVNTTFSIDKFSMINDLFNANRNSAMSLCRGLIDAAHPYGWGCSMRLDLLDEDLLDFLWAAGCEGLFAGLESGSSRIQRIIDKRLDIDRAVKNLAYALKKGFHTITSFVIGFVEETREDLRDTLELHTRVLEMGVAESQINLLTPLQGSRLFREHSHRLKLDARRGSFTNNAVLPEHDEMIRSHQEIFASFYHFELQHLTRQELIETEMLARTLSDTYRASRRAQHTGSCAKAI